MGKQGITQVRDPLWLSNPGQTSLEVLNRVSVASQKKNSCPPKFKKKVVPCGGGLTVP